MKKIIVTILVLLPLMMLQSQDIWTQYNEQNSPLPNNTVRVIEVDAQNRKWIGTDYGLAMYNDTSWLVYNTQNSALTDNRIRSLFANQNHIWVGTLSGGLYSFDGTNWTNYNPSNCGIPDYCIRSISIDSLNRKWVGTVEGLAMYNDSSWRVWTTDNSALFSNNIAALKAGTGNRMTAGTVNGGIAVLYDTAMTVYSRNNNSGIPDNSVLQIDTDSMGHYWFASPAAGVFVDWGGLNWQIFNQANSGMPVSAATCIFIDAADRQYIGTEQNGLVVRTMPDNWQNYTTFNSALPDNAIHAVIKDKDNGLWIGTHQEGLVLLRENISSTNLNHQEIINIFPNPATDKLYIDSDVKIRNVDVFDFNGRKINITFFDNNLDVNTLAKGFYMLEIRTDKQVHRKKVLKL